MINNFIRKKFEYILSEYSIIFAFIIIFLFASLANNSFMSMRNLINILRQVSIIGIISLGMTLVIISGGIDLSVGSALAFIGTLCILTLNKTNSILLSILVALLLGALIGLINGFLITKGKIAPFISTLGMMAALRSLSLYINKGGSISGNIYSFTKLSNGEIFGIAYPIIIFIALTIIINLLLQDTAFGRYTISIGSNEKAALLSAINVDKVKIIIYALCSTLVSISSIIESSRLNSISSASSGVSYELDAIAAVIIGGTRMSGGKGKILGTFFGVLILGILNNTLNLMNISPYLQGLVKGVIIIVAVLIQKKE
ncbi:ABC transporter permease [Caloramator sp. CAR-1]|nr:ABC transporter permease [Caloramator sp. CAR-1]